MANPPAPFQPLLARMSGLPPDETFHDGVPEWLADPLQQWLVMALHGDEHLGQRIVIRLRWRPDRRLSSVQLLQRYGKDRLLTMVDALLQLHPGWDWPQVDWGEHMPGSLEWWGDVLGDLEELLVDGGSLYTVDIDNHRLMRRVDATAAQAVAATVQAADPTAADHLRTAWAAAYGLNPDPDKAYDAAVLAVEALACPLVCPKNPRRTLGTVIADLRNQAAQWALVIGDSTGQPSAPDRLVGMLELLWQGQSRHAGSPNSRQQTQAEAEAALYLAVTVVQWLTANALYHR